jgi:hypothetical protein
MASKEASNRNMDNRAKQPYNAYAHIFVNGYMFASFTEERDHEADARRYVGKIGARTMLD